MSILAIDPGNKQSGWCHYDDGNVVASGVLENQKMLGMVEFPPLGVSRLAIEMIASFGMPVGREVFETCVWIGRFKQAYRHPDNVDLIFRKDVKMHLCGSMRAKDGNIRQAIIDRYQATGGGKIPQIGTKSHPGPLYGVSSHAWAALGVAIVASEVINLGDVYVCTTEELAEK